MIDVEKLIGALEHLRRKAKLNDKKAVEIILGINQLSNVIYGLKLSVKMDEAIDNEIETKRELLEEIKANKGEMK